MSRYECACWTGQWSEPLAHLLVGHIQMQEQREDETDEASRDSRSVLKSSYPAAGWTKMGEHL